MMKDFQEIEQEKLEVILTNVVRGGLRSCKKAHGEIDIGSAIKRIVPLLREPIQFHDARLIAFLTPHLSEENKK